MSELGRHRPAPPNPGRHRRDPEAGGRHRAPFEAPWKGPAVAVSAVLVVAMSPGLPAVALRTPSLAAPPSSIGAATAKSDQKDDSGSSKTKSRSGYGGRATGSAPLITLPDDPAYRIPGPPTSATTLEDVDEPSEWQANIVCDPVDRPGVEAFGNLVGEHYGRPGYTSARPCINQKSDHHDGRAIDWQLNAFDPADRRIGDAMVTWLTADDGLAARRLGIQSVIWNRRVWHSYDGKGWQGYSGQSAHTDHVHVSFSWDGANMRTSWWTGIPVENPDLGPCPGVAGQYAAVPRAPREQACSGERVAVPQTGYADVRPGEKGAGASLVQPLLDVPRTGELDRPTREALIDWQAKNAIPETGVVDQMTYAVILGHPVPAVKTSDRAVATPDHLRTSFTPYKRTPLAKGDKGPAVEVLQEALGVETDGDFGPATAAALLDFTTTEPLLVPAEETTALTWHLLEQRAHPTLPYRDIVLELGDSGAPVQMLQKHLGLKDDGEFGPLTERAVVDAQTEAGLKPSGSVTGETWAVIDSGDTELDGAVGKGIDPGTLGQQRHTDY